MSVPFVYLAVFWSPSRTLTFRVSIVFRMNTEVESGTFRRGSEVFEY